MSVDVVREGVLNARPALRLVEPGSDAASMEHGGGGGGGAPPPSGEGPAATEFLKGAPFSALGKSGMSYWFIDSSGEIVSLAAQALGQWQSLVTLCGGAGWLKTNWRATDREGNPVDAFNARKAGIAIMSHCTAMPLFDPDEPRRRYGLWPVAGGAALHLGREVVWCGEARPAGFRGEGALWPRLSPRPAPAAPAPATVGVELEALLRRWNWTHADAPAVMLGIIANGMLGSCSPWRAHCAVIGLEGSGKSTLLRDVVAPLCPLTRYLNSYTEAGLRQMLSETAAALILDEADSSSGRDDAMLGKVIELLRRASSGKGLEAVKGGSDHQAKSFNVTAAAVLGAILPPPLTPQDASRFTVLTLNPLRDVKDIDDILQFVAAQGPGLWGRMVAAVGQVRALFALLRRRLIARGHSPRNADQLAIIAAARWVAVSDRALADDPEELDEALGCIGWLIESETDRLADSGGNQALQRLLAAPADMAGDKLTLGQLLERRRTLPVLVKDLRHRQGQSGLDPAEADGLRREAEASERELKQSGQLLGAHGLRWGTYPLDPPADAPPPLPGLYVTVSAQPRLMKVFADTPWAGQRWGAALAQLPDVLSSKVVGTVRLGGGKPRCCWIPEATLGRLL